MARGAARSDLDLMTETPLPPDPASPGSEPPHAADDAPTTTMPPAPRRLLRSRNDRVLGGVCGGLAEYFRIDPLIVRVAAVALAFIGGASIIPHLPPPAPVPHDDGTRPPAPHRPPRARA